LGGRGINRGGEPEFEVYVGLSEEIEGVLRLGEDSSVGGYCNVRGLVGW
jgi:hypothetical protein